MNQKKILYIMRYRLDEKFNLKAKFDGQLAAFERLGFDASFIAFDRQFFYLMNGNKKQIIGKTHFSYPSYVHTFYYFDLYKLIIEVLKSEYWDYVYWRVAPCWFISYKLAKIINKKNITLIYEYATFPIKREKQQNYLRELFFLYSDFWQKKIDQLVDCFIMIGEDVHGSYRGKPAINITNGIDIKRISSRNRKIDPDVVHILALASMSYWHGYDRLIKSLAEYHGEKKVIIHMVGGNDGGCFEEWKKLTGQLELDSEIIFHGQLTGSSLEEMFDICDVGINSLGMYRKGFSVTSELKTREYAARGLPFVCSVEDPALADAKDVCWMQVPNDNSIPDMEKIVEFALKMRNDEHCVEKLREYAKKKMSWESQYRIVFNYLEGENL